MSKHILCIGCKKQTTKSNRRPVSGEDFRYFFGNAANYKESMCICNTCRFKVFNARGSNDEATSNPEACSTPCETLNSPQQTGLQNRESEPTDQSIPKSSKSGNRRRRSSKSKSTDENFTPSKKGKVPTKSPTSIKIKIPRTSGGHKKCVICLGTTDLKVIPKAVQLMIYLKFGVLVSTRARCCSDHLIGSSRLHPDVTTVQEGSDETSFNRTELLILLSELRAHATKLSSCVNFDNADMSTDDCYNLTGIYMHQLDELVDLAKDDIIRNSHERSVKNAVGMLLMKLRTGLSLTVIATLFKVSKVMVSRAVHSARIALMKHFVPKHLGFAHISRDEFIERHTRPLAKRLFAERADSSAILVLDGTYVYIQKSSNYSFQRRTYSMHKHRPLVKPMVIVGTDGYILSILGPYFADAKNNDAKITEAMLRDDVECIKKWLQRDDIFVVDRGFRDCLEVLSDLGIETQMPHFLPKGQNQHTAVEANQSRLVTKIRWVVESTNGRLKQWKSLEHVMPNSQIPFIGDYVQIVAALCNAYRPPLVRDTSKDEFMATRMLALVNQENKLQERVEKNRWAMKKVCWKSIDDAADELSDFPKLSDEQLCEVTLGVYQLKQAPSYTQEHKDERGMYSLWAHKQQPGIARVKIQSRHTSSKQYNLWIEYDETDVTAWYCQCRSGARVVGCCAHVASVMWYLGFARHTEFCGPAFGLENHLCDAALVDGDSDWEDNTND